MDAHGRIRLEVGFIKGVFGGPKDFFKFASYTFSYCIFSFPTHWKDEGVRRHRLVDGLRGVEPNQFFIKIYTLQLYDII